MTNQFRIGQRVRVLSTAFTTARRSRVSTIILNSLGNTTYVLDDGGWLSASELADDEPSRRPAAVALPVAAEPAAGCRFSCPRSCPAFERVNVCRFSAMFRDMGVTQTVNSHTVRVDVKFRNIQAFCAAAVALGGSVLGNGCHKLFSESVDGYAVKLGGAWRYPIVATADGSVAFDNFAGRWGAQSDVDALRSEYAVQSAKLAADALGWYSERSAAGLVIHHPDGGTLTVDAAGGVDAAGFHGIGCHDAAAAIGAAIGRPVEFSAKPEYFENQQRLTAGE